jgi:fumarate reductase (CoM/CoB) subunit A
LGGNSLAETQVFGARAGWSAGLRFQNLVGGRGPMPRAKISDELAALKKIFASTNRSRSSVYSIRRRLAEFMDKHVGLARNAESLQEASKQIEILTDEFSHCRKEIENYHSFAHVFECSKMLVLARIITQSALFRTESRGAHFRQDFPIESSELYNTHVRPKDPDQVDKVSAL